MNSIKANLIDNKVDSEENKLSEGNKVNQENYLDKEEEKNISSTDVSKPYGNEEINNHIYEKEDKNSDLMPIKKKGKNIVNGEPENEMKKNDEILLPNNEDLFKNQNYELNENSIKLKDKKEEFNISSENDAEEENMNLKIVNYQSEDIISNVIKNKNSSEKNSKGYISNFELTKNIGFSNIGHTCYMNSFLQILLHIPSFLPNLKLLYKNKVTEDTLIYNLIKLSEYPKNTKYLYGIKKIIAKTHPKYGSFTQNDTQNFAIDFIDAIINEIKEENSLSSSSSKEDEDSSLNKKENKEIKKIKYQNFIKTFEKRGEKTFIEDLFFFTDSSISYKGEIFDIKKISFDLLMNIELIFPIQNLKNSYSLYELLDIKYSNSPINDIEKINKKEDKERETIEKNNKENIFEKFFEGIFYTLFGCCLKDEKQTIEKFEMEDIDKKKEQNYCKVNNSSVIKEEKKCTENNSSEVKLISKIVSLPKILIISFDRGIEGKELISSFVSFDEILELKNYIDKDLYDFSLGTTYKIYAINIRQGSTKASGHCYSYVKVENEWICFNDSYTCLENPKFSSNSVAGLYYIKQNL